MYEESRSRRNPLRYLAPFALAAVILATYLVVHGDLSSTTSTTPARSTTNVRHSSSHGRVERSRGQPRSPAVYVVKSGDSLSVISQRTGVSLPKIERLNPGVGNGTLQVGQRLKLR